MNIKLFLGSLLVIALIGVGLVVLNVRQPASNPNQASKNISYSSGGISRMVTIRKVTADALLGARFVSGDKNASNTIVEFSDYQCPACATFATQIEPELKTRLVETGKTQFAYRDYPLPQHQNAKLASVAAACAHLQGRFEPMKTILFRAQNQWENLSQTS